MSPTTLTLPTSPRQVDTPPATPSVLAGLALAGLAAVISVAVNRWLPTVSPLLLAILLGVGVANLAPRRLPARFDPGLALASRRLLRLGIVLLGLQLVLGDILALGWPVLVGLVAVVGGGIGGTLLAGRLLKVAPTQSLLIACGFSICGAAAIAGLDGVLGEQQPGDRRRPAETATAIALVVLFGSAMIALMPALTAGLGMSQQAAGVWTGASVHEVAQVVAAGALIGGPALKVAVIVKLARVLMLAPVLALVSWQQRQTAGAVAGVKRPPIMPLFVAGFLLMVVVRSLGVLDAPILAVASLLQTGLLAAAMFALGCSAHWSVLRRAGGQVLALAAFATTLVLLLGFGTAVLAGS